MHIGFLIITFGNNYLENCISSIRNFYDYPIYIIDNHPTEHFNTYNHHSIYYSKNVVNGWELGAIWQGCKVFHHVDKFIILHNSMMFIEKLPIDIENCSFMSFWKTNVADYSTVVGWVKDKLKNIYNDVLWYSITGCCCIIDTIYLKKLIDMGYDSIYPTKKIEAVGTEILLGYLISNVLNLKNISLFECSLNDNMIGKNEFKYIKKIAGNQGCQLETQKINLSEITLFDEIFNIDLSNCNDLTDCYIKLIDYVDTHKEIEQFLIDSINYELIYPSHSFSVILSIRHRMFTKLHFPTYYKREKELILNRSKIIY